MRRPGSIVTLSSFATAVVGIAVTTGAARITAEPAPAPAPQSVIGDAAPVEATVTTSLVDAIRAVSQVSTPAVVRPEVTPESALPEIVFESELPTPASNPVVSRSSITPAMQEAPGRRRVVNAAVATEGGLIVGEDHAPEVGEIRYFNGRPIRAVRSMRMKVTAYSPDHRSCGIHADGITASGYSVDVNGGRLVAADRRLFPFGALVSVPGYASGQVVPVLDRGGAIKGSRLDVLYPTHEIARQWGVQHVDVMVWEYADGEPIGFKRPRGR